MSATPPAAVCAHCGARLLAHAKFCDACGRATARHVRRRSAAFRTDRERGRRATLAVASVYVGILLGIAALWRLAAWGVDVEPVSSWLLLGVELAAGATAIAILGADAFARSLGGRMPARSWWWGPALGIATFAVSFAYVELLTRAVGEDGPGESGGAWWVVVLEVVVLAPLAEEWLCRGVLWDALRRVSSPRTTLLLTSVLFGLLHCAGGLLGFPHRFVGGLVFGWLRHRTGSLWPGIAAHAVHNLLAVSVPPW